MSLTSLDKENIKQLVENKTPFKVKVKKEDSVEFQELLFSLDVEWFIGGKRVQYGLPTLFYIKLKEMAEDVYGLGIGYFSLDGSYIEHTTYEDNEGRTHDLTELVLGKEASFNKVLHPDDIKQITQLLKDEKDFFIFAKSDEQLTALQELSFSVGVVWFASKCEVKLDEGHFIHWDSGKGGNLSYTFVCDHFKEKRTDTAFEYKLKQPVKEMNKKINLPQKAIAQIVKAIREKKPFKVRVNKEQSEAVQLLMFKYDIGWALGGKEIRHLDLCKPFDYLFYSPNTNVLHRTSTDYTFSSHESLEINLNEEYNLPLSAIKKIVYSIINKQPFKVRVTPEQSKEVQQIVFDLGGCWCDGDIRSSYKTNETCLYVDRDAFLSYSSPVDNFFFKHENKEIKLTKQSQPIILSKKGFKRWVKQRRPFMIATRSDNESRWVQETLFAMGVCWGDMSKVVDLTLPALHLKEYGCGDYILTHSGLPILTTDTSIIQLKTPVEMFERTNKRKELKETTFNLPKETIEEIKQLVSAKTPFKMRVNEQQSEEVQKLLFSLGIYWEGEASANIKYTKEGNITYRYYAEWLTKWYNCDGWEESYKEWEAKEVFINKVKVYATPLECIQAMQEGKILYKENVGFFKIKRGELRFTGASNGGNGGWIKSYREFNSLTNLTEYVQPVKKEWFDDLGEGKLAWVKYKEDKVYSIDLVIGYRPGSSRPFICDEYAYDEAKPMTKEEVLSFLVE